MIREYVIKYIQKSTSATATAVIRAHSAEDAITQLNVLIHNIVEIVSIEPKNLHENGSGNKVKVLHD
tara:strand:+ start:189 stop:389 length:201 start_codon:yes stop_codon:yes gene_type:complete